MKCAFFGLLACLCRVRIVRLCNLKKGYYVNEKLDMLKESLSLCGQCGAGLFKWLNGSDSLGTL